MTMGLFDMLVSLAKYNLIYPFSSNAVASSYLRLRHALLVQLSNLDNLLRRELGGWGAIPTLLGHILHVVGLRTQKEMPGVDAKRVIAFVQNHQVVRYGANGQFPTESGRVTPAGTDSSATCKDGATFAGSTSPSPTVIRAALVYLLPKTVCNWTAAGMPDNVLNGMAFDMTMHGVVIGRNLGFLAATTVAVTIGNIVRGIMGSHQKFTFWCHAAGRFQSSLRLFAFGFTPSFYHMRGV